MAEQPLHPPPRSDETDGRTAGWLVVAGVSYFVLAIALLHAVRPDVDPIARVTSEYAVGAYGALMTSAYAVLGIALVALAIGLARSLSPATRPTPAVALLLLAALATATAGLFPVDVGAPRPVTRDGWIHRFAAIVAFTSMTMGPLLLAGHYRAHPDWRNLAWLGWLAGATGLLGLVAIQMVLLERGLAGAAQRIILALIMAWMLTSGLRLLRRGRPEGRADAGTSAGSAS